jgi:hypothetical protein
MSPVQAGGGKGSGQKPGSTAGGRPASGTKPSSGPRTANGAGKAAPGRRPAPGPKTASGGGRSGGPGGRGPKGPGGYKPGAQPQRFSPSTIAFIVVAVVVVIVVAFVVVKVTSSSKPQANGLTAPTLQAASPSLVAQVTGVSPGVAAKVGLPSSLVAAPTFKGGQPPLTIGGKPGAVFIGGEFCPYCAAERWSIIMAFSKFGTFSNLQETTSSPWDTDPATATFSFVDATYSSPYINFDFVEHESNDTDGLGTRTTLQPLTALESHLWAKYDNPEGFPFLDIGNKAFVLTPSYNPEVLSGLDQEDIASKLTNANDPVTQSIVGTANYLTASICAITGQKPASACSPAVVGKAAKAIGLN